jgi:hypothetical protein
MYLLIGLKNNIKISIVKIECFTLILSPLLSFASCKESVKSILK